MNFEEGNVKRHFRNEISVFAPRRPEAVKWLKAFPSKSSNTREKRKMKMSGNISIQLPGGVSSVNEDEQVA